MLLFSFPAEICLTEHLTYGSRVHMSSHEHNKSPVLTHQYKNSIRDARTPQPGKIVYNTMRYRSSETVHRLGYFQSSVSVQIMFK